VDPFYLGLDQEDPKREEREKKLEIQMMQEHSQDL
jgi:hypothetical protein